MLTTLARITRIIENLQSGPSFIVSSPSTGEQNCFANSYPVCPKLPPEDYNYINETFLVVGYALFALQAAISLGFLIWIWYYRNSTVVKIGQPEFLSIVCVGSIMLGSVLDYACLSCTLL